MGYGDLGCYGNTLNKTPNIDRLASEGQRWTDFYSAGPVCVPSRYGMMTGFHPVLARESNLSQSKKVPLPAMLKTKGYRTALIGKWHLGRGVDTPNAKGHPLDRGFDHYYGTPASNDIPRPANGQVQNHALFSSCDKFTFPCPLMRGRKIIEKPANQELFTQRYTREAVQWISDQKQKDAPFFLYLAHNMPHAPVFASPKFQGRSQGGRFGDVVEEIDWSLGQIMKTLKERKLDDNTLVIFTSDNGPWEIFGEHAGTAGPLSGEKSTCWEGGQRVPAIFRWRGRIAPGVSDQIGSNLDFYATLAKLTGGKAPQGKGAYSHDLTPALLRGQASARTTMLFQDWAFRSGRYKIHFRTKQHADPRLPNIPRPKITVHNPPLLFDLKADIGEHRNLAAQRPKVLAQLVKEYRALLASGVAPRARSKSKR